MSPRLRSPQLPAVVATFTSIAVVLLLFAVAAGAPEASTSLAHPAADIPLDAPVVINEVMPLALGEDLPWVELYVNTAAVFLPLVGNGAGADGGDASAAPSGAFAASRMAGWQLRDGDGNAYTLPADLPALPPETFVLVHFDGQGAAANDYDASDGRVELHTPAGLTTIFDPVDQVALFASAVQTTTTLVDFVAYGDFPAARADLAVEAGQWPPDTFVGPTEQIPGGDILSRGGSIGRFPANDTNGPEEWTIFRPQETTPRRSQPRARALLPHPLRRRHHLRRRRRLRLVERA